MFVFGELTGALLRYPMTEPQEAILKLSLVCIFLLADITTKTVLDFMKLDIKETDISNTIITQAYHSRCSS